MSWPMAARRVVVDGLVLGGLFTLVAVGSLWLDARIWIEDYPPDIRAAVGSDVTGPLWLRLATAAALVVVLLGGVTYSNWRSTRDEVWAPRFATVFLHTLGVLWMINVVDVLIVDWLIFVTIRPDFIVLPGTEGLAGYGDYGYHLRQSVLSWTPWAASLALSGVAAVILPWLWVRRPRVGSWKPRS